MGNPPPKLQSAKSLDASTIAQRRHHGNSKRVLKDVYDILTCTVVFSQLLVWLKIDLITLSGCMLAFRHGMACWHSSKSCALERLIVFVPETWKAHCVV